MLEMSVVHVLPSAADNYEGKAFHTRGPGNGEILFYHQSCYVRVERCISSQTQTEAETGQCLVVCEVSEAR